MIELARCCVVPLAIFAFDAFASVVCLFDVAFLALIRIATTTCASTSSRILTCENGGWSWSPIPVSKLRVLAELLKFPNISHHVSLWWHYPPLSPRCRCRCRCWSRSSIAFEDCLHRIEDVCRVSCSAYTWLGIAPGAICLACHFRAVIASHVKGTRLACSSGSVACTGRNRRRGRRGTSTSPSCSLAEFIAFWIRRHRQCVSIWGSCHWCSCGCGCGWSFLATVKHVFSFFWEKRC